MKTTSHLRIADLGNNAAIATAARRCDGYQGGVERAGLPTGPLIIRAACAPPMPRCTPPPK